MLLFAADEEVLYYNPTVYYFEIQTIERAADESFFVCSHAMPLTMTETIAYDRLTVAARLYAGRAVRNYDRRRGRSER